MDKINTISIMEQQTMRQDLADTDFKFFDRIEGYIYPGCEVNRRQPSTKVDSIESISVGYDAASSNPFKNLGEFIQSSGKMALETFKFIRNPNTNRMILSFEFLNQDKATYTINEAIMFFAYALPDRTVSFMSPQLKLIGGISGQTRLTLSKYNLRYVHDYERGDTSIDNVITDMKAVLESPFEIDHIPAIFEVYIK